MACDFKKWFCCLLLFSVPVFVNCSTNRNGLKQDNNTKYFSSFEFDKYGIPLLNNEIEPSRLSDMQEYYLVNYTSAGPENIYILKQVSKKNNLLSPFRIIYEWTGKGFKYGQTTSKQIIEKSSEIGGASVKTPITILSVVPGYIIGSTIFVASSVTGFIIGLAESGPEAYKAIKSVHGSEGIVLGKYILYYDDQKRIERLVQFSSGPDDEKLSETKYYYRAGKTDPFKSINYSYVDKKKRIIY